MSTGHLVTMDPIISILSVFCLVSAFVTFGLGIAVFVRNPQSDLTRLFLVTMISATYWAIGEFMIFQSGTPEGAWFWLKASSFWPFAVSFTLHFGLTFTRPGFYDRHPRLTLAFIYLPSAVITGILLLTDWIYTVISIAGSGYGYLPVKGGMAYPAEAFYIFIMMLAAVAIIYSYWKHATTPKVKSQALILWAGMAAVLVFGSLSGFILPYFSILTPNLVFIGIMIFSYGITVAIRKHELFVLSPATAVPDILRTMPDAMVLADINGCIISANESCSAVLGIEGSTLTGKYVSSVIPGEAFYRIRARILKDTTISGLETKPASKASSTVSIAGSLVSDPGGDPAGMVLIIRDITDRIATENALLIAGKKISLLTQLTRHDVNNLVSALSGYLLLLKDDPDDPGREGYIAASMDIAEKIYNQLQFTREYQDIGSRQPVWLPLEEALARAMNDISGKDIIITRNVFPVDIFTDPSFVKVIYNILENAFRHGGRISKIEISTHQGDDGTLRIIIEDDGIGIANGEKESVFQYGIGRNTGLGLPLSRDILSLTGITIAETGVPGSGARFEIVVPSVSWRAHQ